MSLIPSGLNLLLSECFFRFSLDSLYVMLYFHFHVKHVFTAAQIGLQKPQLFISSRHCFFVNLHKRFYIFGLFMISRFPIFQFFFNYTIYLFIIPLPSQRTNLGRKPFSHVLKMKYNNVYQKRWKCFEIV